MERDADPARPDSPKAKIFISYSRKDMDFVDRLELALKTRGFEPLIDRAEIYAFEDWWKRLQSLISSADTVVFALSPDAVASREASKEVEYAASLNKRFAPVVCRRVKDDEVPDALRRLNFVFFDDAAAFETNADRLAEALQTDIDWIRQHTAYGEAARHWSSAGRPGGLLLRSPALEEAEQWIASRPHNAPAPTGDTQAFIAESRRGTTRRRNVLTGGLAAGLLLAIALAGLAYWQRGIAVQQRQRAEDTLAAATQTANSLVFDLAQRFRDTTGIPAALVKDILDRARALQEQLMKSGEVTPALQRSQAAALDETVESLLTIGDAGGALSAATQARQIVQGLLTVDPNNIDWQHGLALATSFVGEVQLRQGKMADALASFRDTAGMLERLTAANPDQMQWQSELASMDYEIGNAQIELGNLTDALASHQAALAIKEKLIASNAKDADLQRELSLSYERIGDLQTMQGNSQAALASFRSSLDLRQGLAQANPNSTQSQRDLSIIYDRIGGIELDQNNLADALTSYNNSLAIRQKLAASDPNNYDWQRDLGVAYQNVGDVELSQKDLKDAAESYNAALAVTQRVANADPTKRRGLAFSYQKVGDVEAAQSKFQEAIASYRQSLEIRENLVKAAPNNAQWQRELAVVYGDIAGVYRQTNDRDNALTAFKQGQTIMTMLTKASPSNVHWQRDLAWFDKQVAALTK